MVALLILNLTNDNKGDLEEKWAENIQTVIEKEYEYAFPRGYIRCNY